jgi:hypothetical protein
MQEFIFLFRSSKGSTAKYSKDELNAYFAKWGVWFEKLNKEGKYISGDRLISDDSKTVTGEEKIITDGPYAESKEIIGGLSKIRAKNIEEAVEISKGCPVYEVGGSVEVRRIFT